MIYKHVLQNVDSFVTASHAAMCCAAKTKELEGGPDSGPGGVRHHSDQGV